jgi:hypothetical protein
MRAITYCCVFSIALLACATAQPTEPAAGPAGPRSSSVHLALAGTYVLSPAGALTLTLSEPCTVGKPSVYGTLSEAGTPCDRRVLERNRVTAKTPWQTEVPGVWTDPGHIAFQLDWKQSGFDPLADDAAAVAARPWTIGNAAWTPTAAEAARIVKLVADATETETELVRGGAAPNLEVTTFEVAEGTLRIGGDATLVVKVSNRGPGTAYRVVATTRSSVTSLHGQRIAFGMIKPGGDKTRRLHVNVPLSETASDTMLVLVLGEGNGFTPKNMSRRIALAASTSAPVLAVHCTIPGPGHAGARPDLDAGDNITLRCVVDNTGTSPAKVELEIALAGGAPTRSQGQAISAAGHATFDVPLTVPRELAIDSTVEIAVSANDRQFARSAHTSLVGVVRKPKLCNAGQLTRAQYRAKLTELRAAVAAGDLTQAQLDRYDAELVTCLK